MRPPGPTGPLVLVGNWTSGSDRSALSCCSSVELEPDLLLLLFDLVSCLLIGGELGMARLLHGNILSKMEDRWKLIGSPQSLRPLAAKGVVAR